MSKSDYLEGASLDHEFGIAPFTAPDPLYIGFYTAPPTDAGGGTEVSTSDWTNYARASVAAGAAQWSRTGNAVTNDNDISFGNATISGADITLTHFGIFDALTVGNLLRWGAIGDGTRAVGTAAATGDLFTSYAHGFSTNDRVVFDAPPGGSLPTGVTAGTVYHVISATTDTFQISTTQGGSAVDVTANGEFLATKVTPIIVQNGNAVEIPAGNLTITED